MLSNTVKVNVSNKRERRNNGNNNIHKSGYFLRRIFFVEFFCYIE